MQAIWGKIQPQTQPSSLGDEAKALLLPVNFAESIVPHNDEYSSKVISVPCSPHLQILSSKWAFFSDVIITSLTAPQITLLYYTLLREAVSLP